MTRKTRPVGVMNGKFDKLGNALQFPGNTVVCHLSDSALTRRLKVFHDKLKENLLYNDLYALLPVESYHITIIDGACKKSEDGWYWPKGLPVSASLKECSDYCVNKLKQLEIKSPVLTYHAVDFKPLINTIAIIVTPDETIVKDLNEFRDELSQAIEIRRQNHSDFVYHITLGYLLRTPSDDELKWLAEEITYLLDSLNTAEKIVSLSKSEFCEFNDMTHFEPLYVF